MEAGEGYRLLKFGEKIEEGDEYRGINGWTETEWAGSTLQHTKDYYRRRIEHPAQDPVFDPPSPAFKVGDRVRVVKKDEDWNSWDSDMDETVGQVTTVSGSWDGASHFSCDNGWSYRPHCLELVTEPEVEPEPGYRYLLLSETKREGDEFWDRDKKAWCRVNCAELHTKTSMLYRRPVCPPAHGFANTVAALSDPTRFHVIGSGTDINTDHLTYCHGTAIQVLLRSARESDPASSLREARDLIEREIARLGQ